MTAASKTASTLDRPEHQGAAILIVNRNFGCGSSREHAPQALLRWGIRAVVESFAEIFYGNCLALGIPCLQASSEEIDALQTAAEAAPQSSASISLEPAAIEIEGRSDLSMAADAKNRLLAASGMPPASCCNRSRPSKTPLRACPTCRDSWPAADFLSTKEIAMRRTRWTLCLPPASLPLELVEPAGAGGPFGHPQSKPGRSSQATGNGFCSGCALSGADLRGRDLRGFYLIERFTRRPDRRRPQRANLEGADLSGAN